MRTINPCRALWALLSALSLCNAQSSVPVATEPIVSAVTVSTVVPSLLTIYSVVTSTSTEAVSSSVATVTTIVDGVQTTLLSTVTGEASARPVVIQTITNTIISTVSVTTSQVVQSTVGFTTILGATSNPPETTSAVVDSTTAPPITLSPATDGSGIAASSTGDIAFATGTSSGVVVIQNPSTSVSYPSAAASSAAAYPADGGLSTGTKAGIAVGVILGVTALVVAGFLLGQRYSRRRSAEGHFAKSLSDAGANEKDNFRAGRPYELSGSNRQPTEMSTGKMHPYSFTTTETRSGSESVSGKSYEMPGTIPGSAVSPYNEPAELSALPQIEKNDAPMYVGVPAHMSGSKRWSMKEYEKS